ncbi:hypothetical protein FRUB_01043 [Fimbriiglobus ruber]|uniref:Uncharacterized protein n=1 Tax=Fimbriiglobus ruber TaxID=1908690 RepID=A0A225E6F4_9BACT|nr:hypothetical protein FRUB_01043 [Fimbriiglobus ruber]
MNPLLISDWFTLLPPLFTLFHPWSVSGRCQLLNRQKLPLMYSMTAAQAE